MFGTRRVVSHLTRNYVAATTSFWIIRFVPNSSVPLFTTDAASRADPTESLTSTSTASTTATTKSDFYALLGVSRGFSMDMDVLKESYRKLMRQHHPDRQQHYTPTTGNASTTSTTGEPLVGDISGGDDDNHHHASMITHAYHTLRKPHTRAMYLMELVGKPIDETSGAARLVGPEFLMQIMEWRERIDEIPAVADCGGDDQVMEELELRLDETRETMDQILAQLDVAFQDHDFDQAMKLVAQLQYWNRIEETIVEKL